MENSIRGWLFAFFFLFVGTTIFSQTSRKANFGDYPADYPLAYAAMAGFPKSPTVKTLFGPHAYFAASLQGLPVVVTLESANGDKERFTAQLLLTLKAPEKGDIKMVRMQITFEADSMSEMTYVRYIKIVNMMSGEVSERRSNGTQNSDGNIMGFFFGTMEIFWDVSKYQFGGRVSQTLGGCYILT
ncbi:MAG: hypothetical protein LBO67_05305 [Spirochaetaceae bacterium]|jgi:hypothetical protein|nr:hypothetical protein [Spirochaetaceae bacterium]